MKLIPLLSFMLLFITVDAYSNTLDSQSLEDTVSVTQSSSLATLNTSSIQLNQSEVRTVKKAVSLAATAKLSTDLNDPNSNEKSSYSDISMNIAYALNSEYKLKLLVAASKDLSQSYDDSIKDTKVSISKKAIPLFTHTSLAPSASLILPTSEVSKRGNDMEFGLEVNPTFIYKLNSKSIIGYLPRMRINSYKYTTNRAGSALTKYNSSQYIFAELSLSDKFSFNPTLRISNNWSHSGRQQATSYLSILELAYSTTKSTNISVGLVTNGTIQDVEYGNDQQVEIYDNNTTQIYSAFEALF